MKQETLLKEIQGWRELGELESAWIENGIIRTVLTPKFNLTELSALWRNPEYRGIKYELPVWAFNPNFV